MQNHEWQRYGVPIAFPDMRMFHEFTKDRTVTFLYLNTSYDDNWSPGSDITLLLGIFLKSKSGKRILGLPNIKIKMLHDWSWDSHLTSDSRI